MADIHRRSHRSCTPPEANKEDTPKMTGILDLAPELVEIISTNIDSPEDFGNFRRACRYLEQCTLKIFREKSFTELSTDFTKESLERLVAISEDGRFAGYVSKLCAKAALDLRAFSFSHIGTSGDAGNLASESRNRNRYWGQAHYHLLLKAMQGLKRLTKISIGEAFSERGHFDYVSDYQLSTDRTYGSYALSLLAFALGETGRNVQTLSLAGTVDHHALSDACTQARVWGTLQRLSLFGLMCSYEDLPDTSMLSQLLGFSTHITSLQIGATGDFDSENLVVDHVFKNGSFPVLTSLTMHGIYEDDDGLLFPFISRHLSSLEELKLQNSSIPSKDAIKALLLDAHHRLTSVSLRYLDVANVLFLFEDEAEPYKDECYRHWLSEDPESPSSCEVCGYLRFEISGSEPEQIRRIVREACANWKVKGAGWGT